ncbi:MAG: hypothetical protein GQ557_01455 [Mycoplasmataceae bacterium]|nr:hypothetical protein [Mycoplasmataceae bacterium]
MKNVTKTLKMINKFTDEEKQEFAEYFEQEEVKEETDKKEVEVEVKEEVKETKENKKEEPDKRFEELLKNFETLANQVKTITEADTKRKDFGAKQKQGDGKDDNSFDTMMAKLTQGQY